MNRKALAFVFLFSFIFAAFAVPVKAGSGATLSAWAPSPPTIDGVLALDEWEAAATATFTTADGSGKIYVMNDANNLYIAVAISDGSPGDTGDHLCIFFDNNDDGITEQGDNWLYLGTPTVPCYQDGCFRADKNYWAPDTDVVSRADDGTGSASADAIYNYFEFSFPLKSGDTLSDFSLSIGDTVGIRVEYYDQKQDKYYTWPTGFPSTEDWGNILVASSTDRMPTSVSIMEPIIWYALFMLIGVLAVVVAALIALRGGKSKTQPFPPAYTQPPPILAPPTTTSPEPSAEEKEMKITVLDMTTSKLITLRVKPYHTVGSVINSLIVGLELPRDRSYILVAKGEEYEGERYSTTLENLGIKDGDQLILMSRLTGIDKKGGFT